jgi:regulatory protein
MKHKAQSLKMRAIGLLSQREHSMAELRRKLLRIQRMRRLERGADGAADCATEVDAQAADDEAGGDDAMVAEVEALLACLQAQGYLSEERFVESRVHLRAQRYGSLRIAQELAQHGLRLSDEHRAELQASEIERARAVWQRKFGGLAPADAAARAKQSRFLIARGFAPAVIRQVLKNEPE